MPVKIWKENLYFNISQTRDQTYAADFFNGSILLMSYNRGDLRANFGVTAIHATGLSVQRTFCGGVISLALNGISGSRQLSSIATAVF